MSPQLSIIIPLRTGSHPYTTLQSLRNQTFKDFEIIVSQDEWANANRARNAGYALAAGSQFVLFSDDDITWRPDGIQAMIDALRAHPEASYSYGSYLMGDRIQCTEPFDSETLKRRNFISTMTVIRRAYFPGFDDSIERLQDWALWLAMLHRGYVGVHCGRIVFETAVRDGITRGGNVTYENAYQTVRSKYLQGH